MAFKLVLAAGACVLTITAAQAGETVSPDAYGSGTSTVSNNCAQQPPDIGKSSGCHHGYHKKRMHPGAANSSSTDTSHGTMSGPSSDGTASSPNQPH
jgi:hypothetical protein